jgi:hypothetical protein
VFFGIIFVKLLTPKNLLIMARIKFGAFITDVAGKIGGTVFSKNKGGAYAKNKVSPSNPKTSYQTGIRAILAAVSQAWRALTDAQRESWNSAAKLDALSSKNGDVRSVSGHGYHQALNTRLQHVGVAMIATPPAPAAPTGITSLSAVADNSDASIKLTFAPIIPVADYWLVEATQGNSPGKKNLNSQYRYITRLANGDLTGKDVGPDWATKFGAIPAVGQRINIRMTPMLKTTGQVGQAVSCTTLVVS